MTQHAVVLAGGGVAGVAWETGVLFGIQEVAPSAVEKIGADSTRLVGTSAGSVVASQLAGGTALETLYQNQLREDSPELNVDFDGNEFMAMIARVTADAASPQDARKRLGTLARTAITMEPAQRRAVIAARLGVHEWPTRDLLITAVDTDSGDLRVFDRACGAGLVDAVSASCAVPGIWPCVEIHGHLYMDGGMRSVTNADLAAGADTVLVLIPKSETPPVGGPAIPPAELDALKPAAVHCVFADEPSLRAFGPNPLDPSIGPAAARAGREQGRRIGPEIATFLG